MKNDGLQMISRSIEWSQEGEVLLFAVYSDVKNIAETLHSHFGDEIDLVELVALGDDRLIGQPAGHSIGRADVRKAVLLDLRDEAHRSPKQFETKIAFAEAAAVRKHRLSDRKACDPKSTIPDPILDNCAVFVVLAEDRARSLCDIIPLFKEYLTTSCILNQTDLPPTLHAADPHSFGDRSRPILDGNSLRIGAGS